jgi:hypothetical protein
MDAMAATAVVQRAGAGAARAGRQASPPTMGAILGAAAVGGFGAFCALVTGQPAFLLFILLGAGVGWAIGAFIEGTE